MRGKFTAKALEYQGFHEADGSHRQIIDLYNSIKPLPMGYRLGYSEPWCAAFVSAMAQSCGCTDVVFPECSCDRMIALYRKAGRWQEADDYSPQPGDLVFYDWQDSGIGDNRGSADHVGIVVSISGPNMKVMEGNLSDGVGLRNLALDARCIRGFACPDFEGTGPVTKGEPAPAEPGASMVSIRVPLLRRGMQGKGVRALQLLLMGAGFGVGPDGADGDFGHNTAAALTAYQKKNELEADGIAGTDTWTALVNQ